MKRKMAEEEKIRLEKILKKEKQKAERDSKCGEVVDGHYVRLHDRY